MADSDSSRSRIAKPLAAVMTLFITGCVSTRPSAPSAVPASAPPIPTFEPKGEWGYQEKGRGIVLTLDENGNGDYPWKKP